MRNISRPEYSLGVDQAAADDLRLYQRAQRDHALIDELLDPLPAIGLGRVDVALGVRDDAVHGIEQAGHAAAAAETVQLLERLAVKDVNYLVGAVRHVHELLLPMPLSGGHEIAGLEGLLKGIVGHHPENKLVFADLGELFGHSAVNFLVEGKSTYFRGHALMVGNKLFLIAMEGIKGNLDEPAFARFLKSFKLISN